MHSPRTGVLLMKKIIIGLTLCLALSFILAGCTHIKADYTTEQFEMALNKGADLKGKTVAVTVQKVVPNSKLGYNIQAGKHLNFISTENPGVKKGDHIVLTVNKVESIFGSYLITYSVIAQVKTK